MPAVAHRAVERGRLPLPLPDDLVLEPGETTFITFTAPVTEPTTSNFVWTAHSVTRMQLPVTATASAEVRTPHIDLTALLFGYAGGECLSRRS